MVKKPVIALMYDFDKTLCTEDMQNYGFIPDVGLTPDQFWGKTEEFGQKSGMERILSYMYVMLLTAKEKDIKLTKEYLKSTAERIVYYKGVENWFKRINDFGKEHGFKVEHYVISSGLKEIIQGSKIAKEFDGIYACEYMYNEEGVAVWPKLMINYTQKTQFVFRISKGVKKISDDNAVNSRVSKDCRHVLYRNMIYIGDGITDIPCMQLIKDKGGASIAVYKGQNHKNATTLANDERVNFICKADYSEGSELDTVVKTQIQSLELITKLEDKARKERKQVKGGE